MNSWTFFQYLFDHFDAAFLGQVQTLVTAVLGYVHSWIYFAVAAWIAGMSAIDLFNPGTDPLFGLVKKIVRAMLIVLMVAAANYNDLFTTFFLTTLPNELTTLLTGGAANGQAGPVGFDTMLNSSWAAGLEIYKNISGWSSKSFGMAICVVLFWAASATAVTVSFLVFLACHILLGLLIVVGPICVPFLLWEKTVGYFNGWLAAILTVIATQVLVVGILALLLHVVAQIMREISTLNGMAGINADSEFTQLHFLIEAFAVILIMAYLTKQLPGLARGIFGGVTVAAAPIFNAVHGALSTTAGGIASAAQAAPGLGLGSSGAAGMRSVAPAGKSS